MRKDTRAGIPTFPYCKQQKTGSMGTRLRTIPTWLCCYCSSTRASCHCVHAHFKINQSRRLFRDIVLNELITRTWNRCSVSTMRFQERWGLHLWHYDNIKVSHAEWPGVGRDNRQLLRGGSSQVTEGVPPPNGFKISTSSPKGRTVTWSDREETVFCHRIGVVLGLDQTLFRFYYHIWNTVAMSICWGWLNWISVNNLTLRLM